MGLIRRFLAEDEGAETVEYALVLGLLALVAVVGITAAGSDVSTWWNSLGSFLGGLPA